MKRSILALVAVLVGMLLVVWSPTVLAGTQVTWTGNGSENLPCEGGGHWILSPAQDITSATLTVNGVQYTMVQSGEGSFSADSAGPLSVSTTASAVYEGDNDTAFLKLSHCLEGEETPTPTSTATRTSTATATHTATVTRTVVTNTPTSTSTPTTTATSTGTVATNTPTATTTNTPVPTVIIVVQPPVILPPLVVPTVRPQVVVPPPAALPRSGSGGDLESSSPLVWLGASLMVMGLAAFAWSVLPAKKR